jgi:hypothetical protein
MSDELRPFPAKDTSRHSLDFSTEYVELEHGDAAREKSARKTG